MKKIIVTMIVAAFFSTVISFAQVGMSVFGGISTPNDKLNMVYDKNPDVGTLFSKGMSIGWHLGARFHVPVDEGLYFFGGLGWNRFNDVQLWVQPKDSTTKFGIEAKHDIIPIGVGMQYYLIQKVIKLYVLGQLNYNYFTTHGQFVGLPAPNFNLSEAANRGGFSAGFGVEVNALLVNPFLEFSYSLANLIGKVDGEPTKSYFMLSLGVNL